jgi:beta-glucoside operon transcriptional antiterminator
MKLKIVKIFNNNVILVEDDDTEMIIMGKGIGFQRGNSESIDLSKVDKKFILDTTGISDKLGKLLNEIPEEHWRVSYKIIDMAKKELGTTFNSNIYITLTDHISFALSRFNQGLIMNNGLLWEVKKLHKKEFDVASKALAIIEEEIGIELPVEEAGSIALHFVNAQHSDKMEKTVAVTRIVNDVFNIVKYHYGFEIDENSLNYNRFMTHLSYFAYRIINDDFIPEEDNSLYSHVKAKYPDAFKCTEKIIIYFKKNFNKEPTKEEQVYLMIHIHRVTNRD